MSRGRLFIEEARPARALAAGESLWRSVSAERPVAMYGATLQGESLVLGHYQRATQCLSERGQKSAPLRRRSGGATVLAGDGISYLALALHDRSTLMACPPQRLLNRNVRGTLQGLRLLGVQANYFGRDFLSFEARPAVHVSWDDDERVLLEFFVSDRRSCFPDPSWLGYPERKEEALRGRVPTTLLEAGARASGIEAIEQIAEGYAKQFQTEWQRESATLLTAPDLASDVEAPDSIALHWSLPIEEAIGFVSAGVSLDGSGKFSTVRLAGDFMAHRGCALTLERMLIGTTPAPEKVARAVDTAFSQPGHDFEGVRNLKTLQEAILDAADLAKRAHEVRT